MPRAPIILFFALIASGCAVTKNAVNTPVRTEKGEVSLNEIVASNLSNHDFSIRKINISVENEGNREEFLASARYNNEGEWLVSLRSSTGIEGARIFIYKDSVLINDRIHKKLIVADNRLFQSKFGLTTRFIPLVFGDVINDKEGEKIINCNSPEIISKIAEGGLDFIYGFDCKCKRANSIEIKDKQGETLKVVISKFKKTESGYLPVVITASARNYKVELRMKAGDFNFEEIDGLNFIPGKGYKREILR